MNEKSLKETIEEISFRFTFYIYRGETRNERVLGRVGEGILQSK